MTLVSTTITDRAARCIDKLSRRQLEIEAAERRKAPTERLGQVRFRLFAVALHRSAQDRARFGFHRSAMPGRAHPQSLLNHRIEIANRQGRH